ncbi:NUDIX domain-containing protein [Salmonella enterica subsp. enterica serovar Choleraesuis]|nr:NUDIX domain-containing protein [Salmonella enterica subsp. enterica serovar Choleraesuis]
MADSHGTLHIGVGVLIFRHGKVLLGRRAGSHGSGDWAAPGGHLEYGETPEQCACREAAEETGLKLDDLRAGPWCHSHFAERQRQYATLFIYAQSQSGEPQRCEPDKCEGWQWFAPDALPAPLFAPLAALIERFGNSALDAKRWPLVSGVQYEIE